MAENLKTTKLNDGKPIPMVKDFKAWIALSTPAYCWLRNDIGNKEEFGALYNFYTVNTKKLCPAGWHVPSKDDWFGLELFLGNKDQAGGKLKEAGLEHWKNANFETTNDYGFTALPAGGRRPDFDFPSTDGVYSIWWSSTEASKDKAWNRGLFIYTNLFYGSNDYKILGCSVRCIKDQPK